MHAFRWLLARFDRRSTGPLIIAVAVLLSLPSLASPLVMDEYAQMIRFRAAQEPGGRSFLSSAFVFAEPDTNQHEMEHGIGAWWTAPDLKVAFFRPLAAASQAVDFQLWPDSSVLMHVHTLLWFSGLLWTVWTMFRRFLTPALANLALALYAWDDARGQVLSWVANRHALIAALLACLAVIAHDKWRRDGFDHGAWLGPALFALALLSSEMAVATLAFLLGHALFIEGGPLSRRLLRCGPYMLVLAAWQVMYTRLGFGVEGSGAYLHPVHEPIAYLTNLPQRSAMLLLGQLTPVASDLWIFLPSAARSVVIMAALVIVAAVALVLWRLTGANAQARFWWVGAALSLLPVAAIGPSDRNLVFVGLGVAPVLALALQTLVETPWSARWSRFVLGTLLVFNLAIAPLLLPLKCLYMVALQHVMAGAEQTIPKTAEAATKTLVVVVTGSEGPVAITWWQRDARHEARPRAARILATTFGETTITRLDAYQLRLHRDAGFFEAEMHELARGRSRPFQRGDTAALSDMTATVTDVTDDGRPRTLEFRFARPLDDPAWQWMRGSGTRLVTWSPPAPGQSVVLSVSDAAQR
ncbi:MAG: uncharacterized protein JWN48_3765 [Myxococcaceae bacterium]|nr:uncharacterized protein [Myxococcaceae bacterium]